MELRREFVLAALQPGANKAELCREYAISRKTAYKWLTRFEQSGLDGLADMSRRPHSSPLRASGEMVLEVVRLRRDHPSWGPKKLRALLLRRFEAKAAPSTRTIARIIERAGLLTPKRRAVEPKAPVAGAPDVVAKVSHDLWTVDFKGWWRARDGARCEPLTVRDAFSRYVLCAQLMTSTKTDDVRRVFERLFEQHGLPLAIQVDNGPPFASTRTPAGLTTLSAWWVSLGIRHVRGRPAHPQDNGGHERMHLDMARELETTSASDLRRQQKLIDDWRYEFNHVRPHEALEQRTPAELLKRSPRPMRAPKPASYPTAYEVRRVSIAGEICYAGYRVKISRALRRQLVGLVRVGDDRIQVRFFDVDLGEFALKARRAA